MSNEYFEGRILKIALNGMKMNEKVTRKIYQDGFQKSSPRFDARIENKYVTLSVIVRERYVNNASVFLVPVQADFPQFNVLANLFDGEFHRFSRADHAQCANVCVEAKLWEIK